MSRPPYLLFAVACISLLFSACGGEDSNKSGDAAAQGDAADELEMGGAGRGRGGLDQSDGGGKPGDGGAEIDADTTTPGQDAMPDVAPTPSCVQATCDEIDTRYQAAVKSARGCYTTAANQCGFTVPAGLSCGCDVSVNSDAAIKTIAKEWANNNCDKCRRICSKVEVACLSLTAPSCQKNTITAAAISAAPILIPIDPGIPIVRPLPYDGTCVRKPVLIQLGGR